MKYKVGDKVRVRNDLEIGSRYQMEDTGVKDTFVSEMDQYSGKVVTIHGIWGCEYEIVEDNGKYNWTDEMFEGSDGWGDCITKVIYNPPATIVWFRDGDKIVSKAEARDGFDKAKGLALCVLKKRMDKKIYNRLFPYFDACDVELKKDADGKILRNKKGMAIIAKSVPLWDVLVRMHCPNGEWEKIKKEWAK